MKNECHEEVEKALKNLYPDKDKVTKADIPENKMKRETLFNELLRKENGNMHFDSGILTGCKQYSLSKHVSVDGNTIPVEICKLKGYSNKGKLTYDDFRKLNEGELIKRKQMQFHSFIVLNPIMYQKRNNLQLRLLMLIKSLDRPILVVRVW